MEKSKAISFKNKVCVLLVSLAILLGVVFYLVSSFVTYVNADMVVDENYVGLEDSVYDVEPLAVTDGLEWTITPIPDQVYTGSNIEPSILVTDNNNFGNIVFSGNYTCIFRANVEVGEAVVIVRGTGDYSGMSASATFQIVPLDISDESITVEAIDNQTYTGSALTPELIINHNGTALKKDIDYTLSYSNNTNASTGAKVTIMGEGNFTGSREVEFTIKPVEIIAADVSGLAAQSYLGVEINITPVIKFNGVSLVKNIDYELSYENNLNVGAALITITGIGNFTGSRNEVFNISPANIYGTSVSSISTQTYTGSALTPEPIIKHNGTTLKKDIDYALTYKDNKNVGTAIITIEGKGNFTGSREVEFTIESKSIAGASFTCQDEVYTGLPVETPTMSLIVDGITLQYPKDYSIKFYDPDIGAINPALVSYAFTYTVTATGQGNYKDSVSTTFTIKPRSLSSGVIFDSYTTSYTYTGLEITPVPSSMIDDGLGVTLSSSDYELSYSNNVDAGQAWIIATGKGNYTGEIRSSFTIKQYSGSLTISGLFSSYEYTRSAIKPDVTVTSELGKTMVCDTDYSVSYSNNTNLGTATITVTGIGNYSGTGSATFTISAYDMKNFSLPSVLYFYYTGSEITRNTTGIIIHNGYELKEDKDYTVEYSNNTNAGTGTITFTGKGNYTGTNTVQLYIYAIDFETNQEWFTFSSPVPEQTYIYTGSEIRPVPEVYYNGIKLVDGVDFDCSYVDNVDVSYTGDGDVIASYARVTITGKGNYSGSHILPFTISPLDISSEKVYLMNELSDYVYTGSGIRPDIVLGFNLAKAIWATTLEEDTDYTLSYSDNINAGEATITITGIGNFTGSRLVNFTIKPLSIEGGELTFEDLFTYTGLEIIPEVTLTVNDIILEKGDYLVVASNNIEFGNANVTITGKGNYTGTINSTFYIAKAALSDAVIDSIPTQNYTGSEITPVPNITYNTRPLVYDEDFTCSYENNVNVGTATIVIVGKGNFDGREDVAFEIGSLVISSFTLGTTSFVYDTVEKFPGIIVKYGTNILIQDKDYSVAGDISATNVGNYAITITGMGGYRGTKTLNWSITYRNLSDCTITLDEDVFTYTGLEHKPNVTIVTNIDEYVIGSDNYTLVYSDNIDAGTGKVTITGTGNLKGSLNKTFIIEDKSMSEEDVVVTVLGEQIYTGAEINPKLTITYNGMELTLDTDYTCSFNNNIDVTSGARILIVGQGNYTSIKVVEFEIKQRDIAECEVVLSHYELTYDAEVQTVNVEVKYGDNVIDSSNYTVTGNSGKDAGTYNVVLVGTNNLKGENNSQTLVISSKQLEKTWIEDIPNQLYIHDGNGNATPVTLDESELSLLWEEWLVAGTDYTIELFNATTIYEDETFTTPGDIPTVTITGKGNYTGTISKYFVIYDNNLAESSAGISVANKHVFTGYEIKPKVEINWNQTNALVEGTDYRVEYSNNINVGDATITIIGLGEYNGVVTKTLEITGPISLGNLEGLITLIGGPYIYNGTEHKPTPTLTYDYYSVYGSYCGICIDSACCSEPMTLVLDRDYTYEISDNINAGNGVITCTGNGNFTGTISKTFAIAPTDIKVSSIGNLSESSYSYTGSAITPRFVVTYNNGSQMFTLEKDRDYTVTYINNVNVGVATIVVTGKGNYTGEITKTFTICSESLGEVLLDNNSYVYDATSKTPIFSVKMGDMVLVNGADYEAVGDLTASDVGSYTITFTGKGNFSGELTAEWEITARPLEDCYITIDDSGLKYTGKEIKPTITIKTAEDGVVVPSDMYAVVYSENVGVGTGKAVITGLNNLTGTITKTYVITPRDINEATMIVSSNNIKYTSEEVRPQVVVTFNGNTLVEGTDYTVGYYNNINAGSEAQVIVQGLGNYDGELQQFFTIEPQNISSATLTIENNTFVYTGSAIDTKAKLVASGVELQKGVDYNVELRLTSPTGTIVDEAKNVANYYLVVVGTANYTGSKFVGFKVVKATPNVSVVCLDSAIFAGKPVRLSIESSSVDGMVYSSQTSYVEGEFAYEYMFVPVDTDNYNVVVGTITLTATKLQVVGLVFSGDYKTEYVAYETLNTVDLIVSLKYNNNEIQELYLSEYTLSMLNGAILRIGDKVTVTYVNNHEIKADLPITISKREVVASCQQKLIDNGEPQEIVLTFDNEVDGVPVTYSAIYYNLATGLVVDNIVNAGKYKAILTLTNENYALEDNEVFFEVYAKTITSTDDSLVIESADGFASDEVLTYDIETDEAVVLEELGIPKFKEDKEFVSVYSFDISEDKDVVVTLSLEIDNVESVVVYKIDNNVLVSLPYSVVEGNKISVSCNTADKIYIFKSLTYSLDNDKVELYSAIVVLLAIIVVGLFVTMIIESKNKSKLVDNKSGNIVTTEDNVEEQNNGLKVIQQESSSEDALLAQYVITDNEGNVIGLKEGAPEELQKAFSELNAEITSERSIENSETVVEEKPVITENVVIEEKSVVEDTSVKEEKTVIEEMPVQEVVQEKPALSEEEMIARYTIVDDKGNVVGLKEDAPEELRQSYSMLVSLKEAENAQKEQQELSFEEMIAKYAIIDNNGNVVGLKDDAPQELKQSYNALLNKNDNN